MHWFYQYDIEPYKSTNLLLVMLQLYTILLLSVFVKTRTNNKTQTTFV